MRAVWEAEPQTRLAMALGMGPHAKPCMDVVHMRVGEPWMTCIAALLLPGFLLLPSQFLGRVLARC